MSGNKLGDQNEGEPIKYILKDEPIKLPFMFKAAYYMEEVPILIHILMQVFFLSLLNLANETYMNFLPFFLTIIFHLFMVNYKWCSEINAIFGLYYSFYNYFLILAIPLTFCINIYYNVY